MCGRNVFSILFFPLTIQSLSLFHIFSEACSLLLTLCQNVKAQNVFQMWDLGAVFVGKLLISLVLSKGLIASLVQTKRNHLNIASR